MNPRQDDSFTLWMTPKLDFLYKLSRYEKNKLTSSSRFRLTFSCLMKGSRSNFTIPVYLQTFSAKFGVLWTQGLKIDISRGFQVIPVSTAYGQETISLRERIHLYILSITEIFSPTLEFHHMLLFWNLEQLRNTGTFISIRGKVHK